MMTNIIGPLPAAISAVDTSLFTIFVDGGVSHKPAGAFDDKLCLSIGDNDSATLELDRQLPKEKDHGDLYHAIDLMREKKFASAKLYGFIGARLDHQMLLLGDLWRSAQKHQLRFQLYERERLHIDIFPAGQHTITHKGLFSYFSLLDQSVHFKGNCLYPKQKEYPKLIPAMSTQGLSNVSQGQFTLDAPNAFCLIYPQA